MNRFAHFVLLAVASVPRCSALANDQPTFHVSCNQRQLFLDDHGIANLKNLTRTMHSPVKRGAVIEPDQPWEGVLQTRCAPQWDEVRKRYKIWLISAGPGFSNTGVGYAESGDGLKWTKPILNQVQRNGSKKNNLLVLGGLLENVVYDPHDPDPRRRFKGLLGTRDRQPIVSADGITWKKLPVAVLQSQDESNLSYDRTSKRFIATLKQGGPNGRSVTLATSKDFEKWTKPQLVFHTDDDDQRRAKTNIIARLADPKLRNPLFNNQGDYNADVYNMGVFRYEGVYIGLPAIYHAVGRRPQGNTDGFHLIQLAMSRDLKNWRRLGDRQPFIGPSAVDSGAYDITQLLPPSAPVPHGDELWFYYTGLKFRHVPKNADAKGGAICLAVLRRDGFLSLDSGDKPGSLLTQPLTLPDGELYVNVAASAGSLVVEVIAADDGSEERILARSRAVTGDHTRARIEWEKEAFDTLKSRTVRLKFTCRRAQFYSYWFEHKVAPVTARLIVKQRRYILPKERHGEAFRKHIRNAKVDENLPDAPKVDLVLELKNISRQDVMVWPRGSITQPTLKVTGHGIVEPEGLTTFSGTSSSSSLQPVIKPGESYRTPIKSLNPGGGTPLVYWSEPGEYGISASYWVHTGLPPFPLPSGKEPEGKPQRYQVTTPPVVVQVFLQDQLLPPFYPDKTHLLHWLDDAGKPHAINKPADWQRRRDHILANMSRVMGPLPKRENTPLDVKVVNSERLETLTRKKVTYLSSKGDRVPAYLLIPHGVTKPRPAILCLHGTSGPKGRTAGIGKPYPRYTLELARRGYVTIAPDYTLLGENQTDPAAVGYVSGTMKGIWNHIRAVDLLVSLPEVDAQRIGCCGVSLGGHNSLFVGVFDPRLKVVVTSSGFDSFLDYMDGDPTGWCQTRYMPRIETLWGKDPQKLPFDFPEVLAAIAPRHIYVHAPLSDTNFKVASARRCVDAARKVYRLLDADKHLVAVYPPGRHGFPPDQREAAYRFIDEVLKWNSPDE